MGKLAQVFASAVILSVTLAACSSPVPTSERQAQVRQSGAEVMPFDLDKTKHSFVKTDNGGVQTVVAMDPTDTPQVELVREHLMEITQDFSAGNFGDPVSIHGADMPGVQELSKASDKLTITFREVSAGGEITYASRDAQTVGHVHAWFDAQTADHGADATDAPVTGSGSGHTVSEEIWLQHHPEEPYPGEAPGGSASGDARSN